MIKICSVPSITQPAGCIGCLIFSFQKSIKNCMFASALHFTLLKYPLNKKILTVKPVIVKTVCKNGV